MSTRLTITMRDNIREQVLRHKFKDREAALKLEERAVFDVVIDGLLGGHKAAIEGLPARWTEGSIGFEAYTEGKSRNRYSMEDRTTVTGSHTRRVPANFPSYHNFLDKDDMIEAEFPIPAATHKLLQTFVEKRDAMRDERGELGRKLGALLNSVTTVKKLYEVWPELAEIVKQPEEQTANGTALTVSVADLNKTIGLPATPKKRAKK